MVRMSPEQWTRLLGEMAQGVSPSVAAELVGVSPAELLDDLWRDRSRAMDFLRVTLAQIAATEIAAH